MNCRFVEKGSSDKSAESIVIGWTERQRGPGLGREMKTSNSITNIFEDPVGIYLRDMTNEGPAEQAVRRWRVKALLVVGRIVKLLLFTEQA